MNPPPKWTPQELDLWRQQSIDLFRRSRLEEPLERYIAAFDKYRSAVEDLIEQTVDLSQLREQAQQILKDKANREIVRYLAGPPISEDDLNTLVGVTDINPRQMNADPALGKRVIDLIADGLDQRRFPWVRDGRNPTEAERLAAVIASAALLANRKVATERRHEVKNDQEDAVAELLKNIGWKEVPPKKFKDVDDAPGPGSFSRETIVGSAKADILVRLLDRRLFPIECKVSNSKVNSIKRLNEAGNKAQKWVKDFGTAWVVPAAVLSGVFDLRNLEEAQDRGLTLFWGHDLARLAQWIKNATVQNPTPKDKRSRP